MKPIWCISDGHADYSKFAAFQVLIRARTEASCLILNGDCFGDTLTKTWGSVWGDKNVRDFVDVLRETSRYVPVFYVAGNHDELTGEDGVRLGRLFVDDMHLVGSGRLAKIEQVYNIRLFRDYLDGSLVGLPGWRFCHGHNPRMGDLTTIAWSTLIGLGTRLIGEKATEDVAQWILNQVFGRKPSPGDLIRSLTVECEDMPVAVMAHAQRVEAAQHWLHDAHCRWLVKHPEVYRLVCGHSHKPEIRRLPSGQVYHNDGALDGYTMTFLSIDPETQEARIEKA